MLWVPQILCSFMSTQVKVKCSINACERMNDHYMIYECSLSWKQGVEPTIRAFGIGSLPPYHI